MSILQSVVNTNISSVSDPNGVGGNLPSSVMAYDMGLSVTAAGNAQAFGPAVLVAGTETIGAYQGDVKIGGAQNNGAFQVITLTFAAAHEWTDATHYVETSFVGGAADGSLVAQTNALSAGTGMGSFPTGNTTLVIKRTCGAVAGVNGQNLQAATMVVRVRERGVAQA
jgi:hypothetical protein